jgi:hypothetical protein
MSDLSHDDWTCAVCAAAHSLPSERCRRCGAALLPFARIRLAARDLRRQGLQDQATALDGGAADDDADAAYSHR